MNATSRIIKEILILGHLYFHLPVALCEINIAEHYLSGFSVGFLSVVNLHFRSAEQVVWKMTAPWGTGGGYPSHLHSIFSLSILTMKVGRG